MKLFSLLLAIILFTGSQAAYCEDVTPISWKTFCWEDNGNKQPIKNVITCSNTTCCFSDCAPNMNNNNICTCSIAQCPSPSPSNSKYSSCQINITGLPVCDTYYVAINTPLCPCPEQGPLVCGGCIKHPLPPNM